LKRLDEWLGQGVRANCGGDEESGGEAAKMQVLPQDVCQVHPSGGFGESDDSFLRPGEISTVGVVMMMMVVVVAVVMVVVMMMMIIGGFSDAAKSVAMENEKIGGI